MPDNADSRLFEMAKQQDVIMHNASGELGVKTSLYLVFAAFMISASIQMVNFAKDMHTHTARCAVLLCSLGAAIALLSGVALLFAAVVRTYSVFPAKAMRDWLKDMEKFRTENPGERIDDPSSGLVQTLIETVDENQIVNERKGRWIEVGAGLLFISLPFSAVGGAFAVCAYFSRPF
jgi:hypothetical protein